MKSRGLFRSIPTAVACVIACAGGVVFSGAVHGQEPAAAEEDEATRYTLIASYPNTPEAWDREELVIRCLFRSHGIRWYSVGSAGATVGVRLEDEDRARRLLAETLLMERLEITLVKTSADGTRAAVMTPEEVLSQPEEDGAE
ncbi:hypothetical protein OVA24_16280 [Luteolibacter sp. SL250]|uniref:hypothetical protein n=1 Tax=Luteolibacter sp. SL250 TaxID=2995170 RepID=UPI00226E9231|nr:hypothetical protein [Luteolibacter sp. SL250]WAC18788.1 hypothetical protein OVA24_16280 [Luteolibacter sp. SL250]